MVVVRQKRRLDCRHALANDVARASVGVGGGKPEHDVGRALLRGRKRDSYFTSARVLRHDLLPLFEGHVKRLPRGGIGQQQRFVGQRPVNRQSIERRSEIEFESGRAAGESDMDVANRKIDIGTKPKFCAVNTIRAEDDGESERGVAVVQLLDVEIRMVNLESQHGVTVCLVDDACLAEGEDGILEVPAGRETVDVDVAVVDCALEAFAVRRAHGKIV